MMIGDSTSAAITIKPPLLVDRSSLVMRSQNWSTTLKLWSPHDEIGPAQHCQWRARTRLCITGRDDCHGKIQHHWTYSAANICLGIQGRLSTEQCSSQSITGGKAHGGSLSCDGIPWFICVDSSFLLACAITTNKLGGAQTIRSGDAASSCQFSVTTAMLSLLSVKHCCMIADLPVTEHKLNKPTWMDGLLIAVMLYWLDSRHMCPAWPWSSWPPLQPGLQLPVINGILPVSLSVLLAVYE